MPSGSSALVATEDTDNTSTTTSKREEEADALALGTEGVEAAPRSARLGWEQAGTTSTPTEDAELPPLPEAANDNEVPGPPPPPAPNKGEAQLSVLRTGALCPLVTHKLSKNLPRREGRP